MPHLIMNDMASTDGSTSTSSMNYDNATKSFLLPMDFVPHKFTIICGRGKVCTTSVGNKRLNKIIDTYRELYGKATNKNEKTEVVSHIMHDVKRDVPSLYGLFCKIENGRYYQVKECIVREKVGGILRDRLHSQYRSSSKAKVAKRKAIKEMNQKHTQELFMSNFYTTTSTNRNSTNTNMTLKSFMLSMPTTSVMEAVEDAYDLVASPPPQSQSFFKMMKPQLSRDGGGGVPRQVSIDPDDLHRSSNCSSPAMSDHIGRDDDVFAYQQQEQQEQQTLPPPSLLSSSIFDLDGLIPDTNSTFSASDFDW